MKKKITINDIAKLAGVSKTTVSFYLNGMHEKMSEETGRRIASAIEATGYKPNMAARSLNRKNSSLVGIIIGDITNNFANQVLKGINEQLQKDGYQMIVGNSEYDPAKEEMYIESFNSIGVDGFIVQPTSGFENIYLRIGQGKPLVIFDSPIKDSRFNWVKTNSSFAVRKTVEMMSAIGYQQFVLVTADPDILYTRRERYDGFLEAVNSTESPYNIIIANHDISEELLRKQLDPYLNSDLRTCIIVANNWLLNKVYLALDDSLDLIPDRVGLIGFDSLEWTRIAKPSITTIVQPAYEEGLAASRMLVELIRNGELARGNETLDCHLSLEDSTDFRRD